MSYMKVHQKVISAEKYCNKEADRMPCSTDTSQPLFPVTAVTAQWAPDQMDRGDWDGGYSWHQEYGLPLTKAILAVATAQSPNCQQ